MDSTASLIGYVAVFCTTISYVPQVWKAWRTRSCGDLSMKMMMLLDTGVALWIAYGFMSVDRVIIIGNALSLCFLTALMVFKILEVRGRQAEPRQA
ncbi:MtN3 and saliva related transmembrane protein [Faunimonas pinastri]|uniref:MtN3 and saliva related transmembrane protein n=1 Tax=Faunimonas pinastri TaxID=1855383 RepID=A0A1H9DGG4_9HYPH|nr:SemiSWEET transporter [Faunimonas pinastri]SEQ11873.1 MtN3 and saliva related transmembrane protein [Faunimonas pinastri]